MYNKIIEIVKKCINYTDKINEKMENTLTAEKKDDKIKPDTFPEISSFSRIKEFWKFFRERLID